MVISWNSRVKLFHVNNLRCYYTLKNADSFIVEQHVYIAPLIARSAYNLACVGILNVLHVFHAQHGTSQVCYNTSLGRKISST